MSIPIATGGATLTVGRVTCRLPTPTAFINNTSWNSSTATKTAYPQPLSTNRSRCPLLNLAPTPHLPCGSPPCLAPETSRSLRAKWLRSGHAPCGGPVSLLAHLTSLSYLPLPASCYSLPEFDAHWHVNWRRFNDLHASNRLRVPSSDSYRHLFNLYPNCHAGQDSRFPESHFSRAL